MLSHTVHIKQWVLNGLSPQTDCIMSHTGWYYWSWMINWLKLTISHCCTVC